MALESPGIGRLGNVRGIRVCDAAGGVIVTLDVILPTYNRAALLEHALLSLIAACPAANLDVRITVVDNGSTDNTAEVVRRFQTASTPVVSYVMERMQGKSYALNTGLSRTSGELVGLIDD